MHATSITIEGFRSYGEPVTIDLSAPGVVLITGENHDRGVSSEGNTASAASGKSSIFKAITTALFEKNDDDCVKDDCINTTRPKGGCCIDLRFTQDGTGYRVVYARKHPTHGTQWTLFRDVNGTWEPMKGEKHQDTAGIIATLIHMNYGQFVNRSYIPQQQVTDFLNRTYQERVQLFSHILNLEACDEYIRKIRDWKKDVDRGRREGEGKAKVYHARVTECERNRVDPEQMHAWEAAIADYDRSLLDLHEQLGRYNASLKHLGQFTTAKAEMQAVWDTCQQYATQITGLQNTINMELGVTTMQQLRNQVEEARLRRDDTYKAMTMAQVRLKDAERQFKQFESLSDTCNTCQQPIDPTLHNFRLAHWRQVMENEKAVSTELSTQYTQDDALWSQRKRQLDTLETKIAVQNSLVRQNEAAAQKWLEWKSKVDAFVEMGITDEALALMQKNAQLLNVDISKMEVARMGAQTQLRQAREAETNFEMARTALAGQLEENGKHEALYQQLGMCEDVVLKFRPHKIAQSRDQFNAALSDYIGFLANGDIQAELVTEVPLANGKGMKAELDILVKDGRKTGVSIKHYSGAEKGGLSLAITGAFHDLSCAQSGGDTNLLLLDEPFAPQDEWGEEQACRLLERMRDEGRTIFVITNHRHLRESGTFDREIRAVKRNDVTTVEHYDLRGEH